jgi:hypothetical protein
MSKILEKLSWQNIRCYAEPHRRFLRIWLVFIAALSFLYVIIPVSYELNWLGYYEPMKDGYVPFIDFHAGYPPIGFLLYAPYAVLSNFSPIAFIALMRITNGFFLSMSVLLIYLIVDKVRGQNEGILSALVIIFSVSTITVNTCSAESVALFFALLAVYYMLTRKAGLTGLFIGLGAMTKLFPGLIIIPAAKKLKPLKDKILLVGSTVLVMVFLNLPFVINNPFMWIGTYTFNTSRGPWESIWALIEKYYSHGGTEMLHPYFEVFIPYSQLATIYPPNVLDHAFYAWNYPWLSTLLSILGIASILLSYFIINEHDVLEGVALPLFMFMFLSKGYSPQFTIFMLPFISMAFVGVRKIGLCAMLEVSTILEFFVWMKGLFSLSLLAFAIILRTVTFILVIALLMVFFIRRREGIVLPSFRLHHIKKLKDKLLVIFILSILSVGASAYYLRDHYSKNPQTIQTYEGTKDLKLHETAYVDLTNLTKNERVMFNLTSTSPINVTVTRGDEKIWTTSAPDYTVRNLFIPTDSQKYSLAINMAYPASTNTSKVTYKIYLVQIYSLPDSSLVYVSYVILTAGTIIALVSLYKLSKKINQ